MRDATGSSLVLVLSVLVWAAAVPADAKAQAYGAPATPLSVESQEELSAIDSQATTATVLLAVGIPAHILGLGGAAIGLLAAVAAGYSGGSGDTTATAVLGLVGGGLAVAGLVLLLIGASLDVGSGVRRDRWRQRYGATARLLPTLTPLPDGAALGLVGEW